MRIIILSGQLILYIISTILKSMGKISSGTHMIIILIGLMVALILQTIIHNIKYKKYYINEIDSIKTELAEAKKELNRIMFK